MAKKNIRKIPSSVQAVLSRLGGGDIVAGYSRTYSAAELGAGKLKHLGVALTASGLNLPTSVIPPAKSGKYSNRNINGLEVVRKDLPKETHYNAVEAPDWGDSSNGTHTVYLPYEKYPRDYYAPQLSPIKISSPNAEAGQSQYAVVFEVDRVFKRNDPAFEANLLEGLNLLQENIGGCGIQKSGATFADYLKSMVVSWEVLPPGTRDEALKRLFRNRQPSAREKTTVEERYDFLMGLKPTSLVYGMSGIQRYFGALLEDDLVVFENIEYGNAVYVMYENWRDLSKRSRMELLSGRFGSNFARIPHGSGWKTKVKEIIKEARQSKKVANKTTGTTSKNARAARI